MTLTKAELLQVLSSDLEMDKQDAKLILAHFFECITSSLMRGEAVKLSGFGNFEVRQKRARPGRNPKTGESVTISARRVVTFKAGLKLKREIV